MRQHDGGAPCVNLWKRLEEGEQPQIRSLADGSSNSPGHPVDGADKLPAGIVDLHDQSVRICEVRTIRPL